MQVRERWADFDRYGARALVVSFADPAQLEGYRDHLQLTFPIATDPEREAYGSYGMTKGSFWRIWGPRSVWAYIRLVSRGRKLQRPEGEQDLSQLGGDVVIDGEGRILIAHVSRDPVDRPPVDVLLAALNGPGEVAP